MRREDQRGGNGSVPGTRRKAVPIARASGPAEYTAGQQELPVRLMVNALECERVLPSNASICPECWALGHAFRRETAPHLASSIDGL